MDRWIDIPECFHSLYHSGPFTRCIVCECDLLDENCRYFVERCFHGQEPIFELAMCEPCRENFSKELSKDSLQRINAHIEERVDLEQRYEDTLEFPSANISPWIQQCLLSKTQRFDCKQYQIIAMCQGSQMRLDIFPIMISNLAAEELQKLMSKKTRDRHEEMVQEFFGMPSEFADGPTSSPLIF